ncbi:beta-galactosidase domain 4-containing protein [Streptomyces sp. NPDC050560]|uniref:beta-galactosidase domain 4-containing protein n=1 Tax=Streptomyces sp. NPDC050560 TaxID=3365630 RepID=UPI0037B53BD9
MDTRKVYEPVIVTAPRPGEPTVTVHNKHLSDGLGGYELRWAVTLDGEPVESGALPAPSAPPGGRAAVAVPCHRPAEPVPGAEYLLTVTAVLRENTSWARAGHTVTTGQFALGWDAPPPAAPAPRTLAPLTLTETAGTVGVSGRDVDVVVDRATGRLDSYRYRGRLLLSGAPGVPAGPVSVAAAQPLPGEVVVEVSAPPARAGAPRTATVLTVRDDGELVLRHPVPDGAPPPAAVLSLPPQYEHAEWYGRDARGLLGRHRGCQGAMTDVRWLALTDAEGRGLTVRGAPHTTLPGAQARRLRPSPRAAAEERAPRAETRLTVRADTYRLLPLL